MTEQQRQQQQQEYMYGCVCKQYGSATDVFEYRKDGVEKPTISDPYHILISNKRTTVNPADCKQRSGNLQLVLKHKFPLLILGQDFAGIIIGIGSSITKFDIGDQIFGSTAPRNGCSAEFVLAYEDECAIKPSDELSWDEVVTIPTGFCTAWRGLFDSNYGNLTPMIILDDPSPSSSSDEKNKNNNNLSSSSSSRKRVLIVGSSGSVGSAAVQLATKIATNVDEVVAICGPNNKEYVKSLGAHHVLDYVVDNNNDDYYETYLKRNDVKFDIILDCVGGDDYYYKLYPYLNISNNKNSYYITCVGPVIHGGSDPITYGTILKTISILLPRFLIGNMLLPGKWNSRYKLYLDFTTKNGILNQIAKAFEAKLLIPPRIDPISPVPLKELGKAHIQVEKGHSNGKVVIMVES